MSDQRDSSVKLCKDVDGIETTSPPKNVKEPKKNVSSNKYCRTLAIVDSIGADLAEDDPGLADVLKRRIQLRDKFFLDKLALRDRKIRKLIQQLKAKTAALEANETVGPPGVVEVQPSPITAKDGWTTEPTSVDIISFGPLLT